MNQSIDNKTMKKLHETLLMIALDFDYFCKKNKIKYYLMGGTALGAMRHKGFIPWDDDFDVFMDKQNYEKFLQLAPKYLCGDLYYLQVEDTEEWPLYFSKIRLNGTKYIEADNIGRQMHHGIYIDVMCLHNAFSNSILRYLQYICGKILSAAALKKRGYKCSSTTKQSAMFVAQFLVKRPIKYFFEWIVKSSAGSKSQFVGHFFGRAPFNATSFDKTFLGEQRYVQFESASLPVIENVEEYLLTRFGEDWMQLPPRSITEKFPVHAMEVVFGDLK